MFHAPSCSDNLCKPFQGMKMFTLPSVEFYLPSASQGQALLRHTLPTSCTFLCCTSVKQNFQEATIEASEPDES